MNIACGTEVHRHPTITPEQRRARQQGRLDQRCRSCGATSAASSWCAPCGSRDLEYREHVAGEVQWCRQDNTPRPPPDPERQRRALARRAAAGAPSGPVTAPPAPDPVSAPGPASDGTLWGAS